MRTMLTMLTSPSSFSPNPTLTRSVPARRRGVLTPTLLLPALLAVLLGGAAPLQAQPRGMQPADQFAIPAVGSTLISPDGAIVLYTVSTTDAGTLRSTTTVFTRPVAGGEATALTDLPAGANDFHFSPESSRLAFFASSDGKNGIWTYDLAAKKAQRVCDYDRSNHFVSKAGNALTWSPDGTQLAFAGTLEPVPPTPDPLVVTRIQYKSRMAFSDNRRSHIYVVPAAGGTPKAITSGEHDEHSIDWSGREIVFLSNREPVPDARLNYDIYAIDAASGAQRQITKTGGVEMDPTVSPDGKWIAYAATTRGITTIDSVAEDAHVWVVPFGGGATRELTKALDRRVSSPRWTADSANVLFSAGDRGRGLIYTVPVAGGRAVPLFERDAQASGFSVSNTDVIVFGMTDARTAREVFTMTAKPGEPKALTSVTHEAVARFQTALPETIRFKSFDGVEVEGWLYPAIGTSGRVGGKSPMILTIHGGPHGMYGYGYAPAFQIMAARGYHVLAINPRGSSGYGQKFSDGTIDNWGGGDYRDLMAGVDAVLKKRTDVDGDRLGVTGGSYGGFMTNWVITQTTRFKAAVSVASVSNLVSFYATSLYQDLVHAEFGGYPWDGDNFAKLWKWSPLAHVRQVTTPTMFQHGELDNDVHITQA